MDVLLHSLIHSNTLYSMFAVDLPPEFDFVFVTDLYHGRTETAGIAVAGIIQ